MFTVYWRGWNLKTARVKCDRVILEYLKAVIGVDKPQILTGILVDNHHGKSAQHRLVVAICVGGIYGKTGKTIIAVARHPITSGNVLKAAEEM
ncbi:MAG: hypothetical protein NTW65_05420 [Deltaproteobacteria bacterium]|nr:hypothetical protein [Deltaproteobacteria bacterium]